jgi:nicotinamidase-related amidase
MTTFQGRPNTALMVIDVQNGVVTGVHDRDGVVGRIAGLVDRARAEHVPVVWVQHNDDVLQHGNDAWRIVGELSPNDSEPVVQKRFGDSFEGTDLEAVLAEREVGRVVVTGAQSDACIRATLHGALVRGYDVTLVGDAHTTEDLTEYGAPSPDLVISHTNLYWQWAQGVDTRGDVVASGEVDFAGRSS